MLNKKNIEHFSNDNDDNMCINLLRKREQLNREIESYECNHFINKRNYLRSRDKATYYDDFAPPERRVPEYIYPYPATNINIPTRGYPDNYQELGIITNDTNTFNLFGRQKYPGSNQYEYYIIGNLNNTNIKLPINIKGDKEIYNDQKIYVDIGNNKMFKTKLYNFDTPRYNPFII